MKRSKKTTIRELPADPVYGLILATKMINKLMKGGKRSLAERIFYKAINIISKNTKEDGIKVFEKAVENVGPLAEVKSRRVGGSNYQVPVDVSSRRREALSLR